MTTTATASISAPDSAATGSYAEDKYIGSEFYSGDETPALSPNPALEINAGDTLTLWADVVNFNDVAGVYAVITPPGFQAAPVLRRLQLPKLEDDLIPILHLTDPNGDSRYTFTLSSAQAANIFTINGDYTISIYAKDTLDNVSSPATTYVTLIGMDAYEPDDSSAAGNTIVVGAAQGQLHNFHQDDDEDWVVFSAGAGLPYVAYTENLGPNCDTYLELYLQNGTTLELVDANDNFYDLESRIYFIPLDGGHLLPQGYPRLWIGRTRHRLHFKGGLRNRQLRLA